MSGKIFYSGKGIQDIRRTYGNGAPGTSDTYTIFYTDKSVSAYSVYNGKDGQSLAPDLSAYSTKAQADLLYKPIGYEPDLSNYYTKSQSSALYLGINSQAYDSARFGGQLPSYYQPAGAYLTAITKAQVEAVLTGAITTHTHNYQTPITLGTTAQYLRGDLTLATFPTLFSGSYNDLTNKPTIPLVYTWALASTKPTYTASEVGADASGAAASAISSHLSAYNHSNIATAYNWVANYGYSDYVRTGDSRLSDARIASDVYAWAKASSKPTYSWSEIGSKPTTVGGYGITDMSSQYVGYANRVVNDSTGMAFHWSGQSGQPTWLWGGNSSTDMYLYNPSNFSVNYASSALSSNSSRYISSPDGDRNPNSKLPTTTPNGVRFDFASAAQCGTSGNYAGVMTYAPWDGTSASTGDASYQLAFGGTAVNGGGVPMLRIRKGIDSTWNSWYTLWHEGNFNPSSYSLTSHTHDYATHRGEGANYIDNSFRLYDNYRGGWRTTDDLYVAYAYSAGNSNSVGGVSTSNIVWGGSRGKSNSLIGGNANTSDASNPSGFFFGNSVTGMPDTNWWNWINCIGNDWSGSDGYGFQLANSFWSDDFRIRRMTSGTWNSWKQIWHSGNLDPNAYATHRGEGTNYIDNSFRLYDNYRGGWRTTDDLYVAYAYSAGNASTVGGYSASQLMSSGSTYDYAHSFVQNGYQKLANGLIFQWGRAYVNNTVTFPIQFPNSCVAVSACNISNNNTEACSCSSLTPSNFYLNQYGKSNQAMWFAIGF